MNILFFLIMFLLVLEFIKCLWELIGLLSDYHNRGPIDMMDAMGDERDMENLTVVRRFDM